MNVPSVGSLQSAWLDPPRSSTGQPGFSVPADAVAGSASPSAARPAAQVGSATMLAIQSLFDRMIWSRVV